MAACFLQFGEHGPEQKPTPPAPNSVAGRPSVRKTYMGRKHHQTAVTPIHTKSIPCPSVRFPYNKKRIPKVKTSKKSEETARNLSEVLTKGLNLWYNKGTKHTTWEKERIRWNGIALLGCT